MDRLAGSVDESSNASSSGPTTLTRPTIVRSQSLNDLPVTSSLIPLLPQVVRVRMPEIPSLRVRVAELVLQVPGPFGPIQTTIKVQEQSDNNEDGETTVEMLTLQQRWIVHGEFHLS